MMHQHNLLPYLYALVTIVCTFLVGQILLWFVPDQTHLLASVLFILMNLLPMLFAFVFVRLTDDGATIWSILKAAFSPREHWYAYAAALAVPLVYYGVSLCLGNVTFTGAALGAAMAYFPWTLLQGGLEEVGWRWYLQEQLAPKQRFFLKMLLISIIWSIWHIPLYRLPWITAASSNHLIFYLMILGNTFTFGAVKMLSRGAVPAIAAHMLIDTTAVLMRVGSDPTKVALLVGIEMALSVITVSVANHRNKRQNHV